MKKLFIYFILFLTIITTVSAQKGHTTLLAVSEDGSQGAKANLFVEIKPGTGKVFLETIPLTKLDTQLSTRFAQQIACDFVKKDCSKKDFFYTIRSDAAIVGGPSAGAAIAATTAALLDNQIIKEDITMTGTINAGGIIGNVGSVKEKILLARTENISTVLIPLGSRYQYDNATNTTIDLYSIGNDLAMNISEVSTLADVLTILTGKEYHEEYGEIVVDKQYKDIMKSIAADLCNRTIQLKESVQDPATSTKMYINGLNLTYQATQAFNKQQYYTTASRCFAANLAFSFLFLNQTNATSEQLKNVTASLQKEGEKFEQALDQRQLETLTDLQTYVVVKERVDEAKEGVQALNKFEGNATTEQQFQALAFVNERLYTGRAWSTFFTTGTQKVTLKEDLLKEACAKKFSELQERFQFLEVLVDRPLVEMARNVYEVSKQQEKGNYKLCLFMATKQKAEIDYTLTVASTSTEKLDLILKQRLAIAEQEIAKQMSNGFFPILGYSYYEYAQYLKDTDPYSSLLFAQYSLELSHIDVYVHEELQKSVWHTLVENIQWYATKEVFFLLGTGFFLGVFCTLLLLKRAVK